MKKSYYPLIVIIIFMLIAFFGYLYSFSYEFQNNFENFKVSNIELPFITEKLENIYHELIDFVNKKYKINVTDYNNKTPIYKVKDNFIILNDIRNTVDIKKIIKFDSLLKKKNKNFAFIVLPEKGYFFKEELNKYSYKKNSNIKSNLQQLEHNSVDYIDSYKILNNSNILPSNLFYKTDHHWTLETGSYFTKELVKYVNNKYLFNLNINKLDNKNFKIETRKNSYQGSFSIYSNSNKKDDFNYYIPKFETNYTVYMDNRKCMGDTNDCIYRIYNNFGGYSGSEYCKIIGGTNDYVRIINNKADNDVKMLFIGNSYTKAITPFLAPLVKEIIIVDIRSNVSNYNKSIQNLIGSYNPDLTLYLTEIAHYSDYDKLFK